MYADIKLNIEYRNHNIVTEAKYFKLQLNFTSMTTFITKLHLVKTTKHIEEFFYFKMIIIDNLN